jgi:hypothetical protein
VQRGEESRRSRTQLRKEKPREDLRAKYTRDDINTGSRFTSLADNSQKNDETISTAHADLITQLNEEADVLPASDSIDQTPVPAADVEDWDVNSVQSPASISTLHDSVFDSNLATSVASATSATGDIPRSAMEEILLILSSDNELKSLFTEASQKTEKAKLIRNTGKLLLLYYRDLQQIAIDHRQKDASNMLGRHAPWFASRLCDSVAPDAQQNAQKMASHLKQQMDKRPLLEKYLQSSASHSKEPQNLVSQSPHDLEIEGEDDQDEEYQDEHDIDYSEFPNLQQIKNFLLKGPPFTNLKRNTLKFVRPEPLSLPGLPLRKQEIPESLEPPHSEALTFPNVSQGLGKNGEIILREEGSEASIQISQDQPLEDSCNSSVSTDATNLTVPDGTTNDADDDGSELEYDPELCEAVPEERILNPRGYFQRLEVLEREVLEHSNIAIHATGSSTSTKEDAQVLQLPPTIMGFPDLYTPPEPDTIIRLVKFTRSRQLLRLFESSNTIYRVSWNLLRLRNAGYCQNYFSLLLKAYDRQSVAILERVEISTVLRLGSLFAEMMNQVVISSNDRKLGELDGDLIDELIHHLDSEMGLTDRCLKVLTDTGLATLLSPNDVEPAVWDFTVQSLNVAVLSYAGAHTQRFDSKVLGEDVGSFQIPHRFNYFNEDLRNIPRPSTSGHIKLQPRSLQCLHSFLGNKPPWIFLRDSDDNTEERLLLSTDIETLTDIWGPSWKVIDNSDPTRIRQYDIGNGAVVLWPLDASDTASSPTPESSEVFCHWVSFKKWDTVEVERTQSSLPRKHFVESDTLLIGAPTDTGLIVNRTCTPSLETLSRIKTKLKNQGALRTPSTSKPKRYVDSQTVQISGSVMGVITSGAAMNCKLRDGNTAKDALYEFWSHKKRNPMYLEAFSGVEVSLCTQNARRRRLLHILGSQTMRNYLRGISFDWDTEACEQDYFRALHSPRAFRKFWTSNKNLQDNVGDAIEKCLDILVHTGIEEDNLELKALWVECFDAEGDTDGEDNEEYGAVPAQQEASQCPAVVQSQSLHCGSNFLPVEEWIVTLYRSRHTWTGFLADSAEVMTVAIAGTTCLDSNDHDAFGQRCSRGRSESGMDTKSRGYPVLQTSLLINESIIKAGVLKKEKVDSGQKEIWNAKNLKRGTEFSLGSQGTLRVVSGPTRRCSAIMEWDPVRSELLQEIRDVVVNEMFLGRNIERHHDEYIRGAWQGEPKPLPVLVLSKSTKIIFSRHD